MESITMLNLLPQYVLSSIAYPRYYLLAAFFILFTGFYSLTATAQNTDTLPVMYGVGGNFEAINTEGNAFSLNDYRGNVVILGFGYTHCADICPFTLGYLKNAYQSLSPELQEKTQVLFVTVDPTTDTPQKLQDFIHYFNKDFVGVTGTQKQTDHIVDLFQARYHPLSDQTIPEKYTRQLHRAVSSDNKEGVTLFNHTINLYLIDQQGRTRATLFTGTPIKELHHKVASLIEPNTIEKTLPTATDTRINKPNTKKETGHTITAHDMYIPLPPTGSSVAAAYGVLHNNTPYDDQLIEISSPSVKTIEVHLSKREGQHIHMQKQKNFSLAAGQSHTFKPLSYHFMLIGLNHTLEANKHIHLDFIFKKAGKVSIDVPIMKLNQQPHNLKHHHE